MRFWITKTSRESYMLTTLPPTIETVVGTDRKKAYVTAGDPVGIKNLCQSGVHAIAPDLRLNRLESKQVDIAVTIIEPLEEFTATMQELAQGILESGGNTKWPESQTIEGLHLDCTCNSHPEQYNVYEGVTQVAYFRLRHGVFRADMPDCGGETVYEAEPSGDGLFDADERQHFLTEAVRVVKARLLSESIEKAPLEVVPDLRPCPFCNFDATIAMGNDGTYCGACSDLRCRAEGPIASTKQEAASRWNARR